MREYKELAAKRLEEIEWLNGVCDDLKNKNALLSAHTELFREEAYRLDDLSTDYAHRLAHWIEKHDSLLAELAKYRDAPIAAYGVLEDQGSSVISWDAIAGWPEAAHEHINDAIQIWKDSGDFVPKYSVVPLIVKPGEEK